MNQALRLGMLLLVLAGAASQLGAHETMFGLGPRTIWSNGIETEVTQEFEVSRFFFSGDNHDENPRDRRSWTWTITPAMTYGVSRDLALRVKAPFEWTSTQTKDGRDTRGGPGDFTFGGAYRFLNNVFKGGSTKASWFAEASLPTGFKPTGQSEIQPEPGVHGGHDDNWGLTYGLAVSSGTTRHYIWIDMAIQGFTNAGGSGPGPIFQMHASYAYRLFQLDDFRDFDVIMLVESDVKFQAHGMAGGDRNPNSGGYFFHMALGFQINITNRVEMKLGYNYPVYKHLFGRQFYHEGEGLLMFSYLF